jgi:hypothetical protein
MRSDGGRSSEGRICEPKWLRDNALGKAHSPAIEQSSKGAPLAGLFRPTDQGSLLPPSADS